MERQDSEALLQQSTMGGRKEGEKGHLFEKEAGRPGHTSYFLVPFLRVLPLTLMKPPVPSK